MTCGHCKTPSATIEHVRECSPHTASQKRPAAAVPAPRQAIQPPRIKPFREQVEEGKRAAAVAAEEAEMLQRRRQAAARLRPAVPVAAAVASSGDTLVQADPSQVAPEVGNRPATTAQRLGVNPKTVPGSKYALPREDGSGALEYVKVEVPTTGKWAGFRFVMRLVGAPGDWTKHRLTKSEQVRYLARVASATYVDPESGRRLTGPEAAAVRYSREHTRCAVCESPLSDPVSQREGLGPVCAGRFRGVYAA